MKFHLVVAALLLDTRQLMKLRNPYMHRDAADNEMAADLIIFDDDLHPQYNEYHRKIKKHKKRRPSYSSNV